MGNEYLRAFVIGSSCFVFLPYFYFVSRFKSDKFNFDYKTYTFLAPISLGFMNLFSLIIAESLGISKKYRFLLTSIISPTTVLLAVSIFNVYNYTVREWVEHIIGIYILYFFVVNFILYYLDKYV